MLRWSMGVQLALLLGRFWRLRGHVGQLWAEGVDATSRWLGPLELLCAPAALGQTRARPGAPRSQAYPCGLKSVIPAVILPAPFHARAPKHAPTESREGRGHLGAARPTDCSSQKLQGEQTWLSLIHPTSVKAKGPNPHGGGGQ